jgi:aminoacrylate hydrolase
VPYFASGEARLYFEEHGAGEPIVFVSGLRGLGSHWRHLVPLFCDRFHVVLHDQLGTGKSDHPDIPYSIERLAQDVLSLLDHLKIERAHLIGHSTGGAIGQVIAIDHPDRLLSLSLLSSWTKADAYLRLLFALRKDILTHLGVQASELYAPLFVSPPWWINKQAAQPAHSDTEEQPPAAVTISRINAILAFDRARQLGEITRPTLVMCSRDDRLTPFYFSEALAAAIPGARLIGLEDGGHSCHQTRPREVADHLLDFINSVS